VLPKRGKDDEELVVVGGVVKGDCAGPLYLLEDVSVEVRVKEAGGGVAEVATVVIVGGLALICFFGDGAHC
jgi:hypothetical protein